MTSTRPSRVGAALRVWVGSTLVALAFFGLLAVSTAGQWELGLVLNAAAGTALLLAVIGVGLTGRHLAMNGRKLRAAIAADETGGDHRRPVLYLRSFADDQVLADANIQRGFIQLSTEEEQYARVLNRIGPFVAIGDPRELAGSRRCQGLRGRCGLAGQCGPVAGAGAARRAARVVDAWTALGAAGGVRVSR